MASLMRLFNRLLPFATPGTPVVQDLLHLAALCGLLYYGPQIQQWLHDRPTRVSNLVLDATQGTDTDNGEHHHEPEAPRAAPQHIDPPPNIEEPQPNPDDEDIEAEVDDGEPGPVRPRNVPAARNIGVKKAKSLDRRNARRAYNESLRLQAERERQDEAERAAERDAEVATERERRQATAAALEAKKAKEREKKREQELRERQEDLRRRERTVEIVRMQLNATRRSDLSRVARQVGGDVDEEWVERIITSSGLLDRRDADTMTLITGTGWALRVTAQDMARTYEAMLARWTSKGDEITYDELGRELEQQLMA